MHLSEIEAKLREAQAKWNAAIKGNTSLEERITAREAVRQAERALSLAKGEETAVAFEWEYQWDTGAPLPHVVASGRKIYLMYVVHEPDPDWDGSYVTLVQTSDVRTIALVEFIDCHAFKFGGPNDEVFAGHPLWGKGLEPYGAHTIAHSRWLAEVEKINMVHGRYSPQRWKTLKHYLLAFHDDIFECLANGHKIEVLRDSLEHVTELARKRLFEHEQY